MHAKNITKVIILFTISRSFSMIFFRFLTSFKIHSGNRHSGLNIPVLTIEKKIFRNLNEKCTDFGLKRQQSFWIVFT